MKRKLDENPKIRASKCRQSEIGTEADTKQKEEQGIAELLGGVKSAPAKRDGLNQTRQSSQPAQQELPLFI